MDATGCLSGKVALVTGGGSGIGRATALALAKAGARSFICGRTETTLSQTVGLAQAAGLALEWRRTDVRLPADVDALIHWVQQRAARLDILINAAGILGPQVPLAEVTPEEWDDVIRTNLTGTFLTCRATIPFMVRQKNGCIINLTSGVGRHGRAGWGPYAVSKFGVEGLTQTLAEELAPSGIVVLAVNPGATRTLMRTAAYPKEDPATLQTPETVATVLLNLVADPTQLPSGKSVDVRDLLERTGHQEGSLHLTRPHR